MNYLRQAAGITLAVCLLLIGGCVSRGPLIEWSHIEHAVADLPPRVLVRTYQRAPVETRGGFPKAGRCESWWQTEVCHGDAHSASH